MSSFSLPYYVYGTSFLNFASSLNDFECSGRAVFSNNLINRQLQKILQHWAADFIYTSRSLYSLVETDLSASPPYIGWLSEQAKADLVEVVNSATGSVLFKQEFHEIFLCDPTKYAFGFSCWDDFFARSFREEIRPVEDPDDVRVIVSPCEAAPLRVSHSVKEVDKFWVKGQPYSIRDILNRHESADDFIGGTIYQAFLSAKSYHRWHAPIGGTVIDVCRIEGSYYLQNKEGIFFGEDRSDSDSQQNNKSLLIEDSQPFLSAVAARCVILIESENTKVGKVAIVFIGMVEISSTEVTVKVGQHVKKGEEIGSFHVGGSSVQVIFERGVEIEWIDRIKETGRGEYKSFVDLDQRNIAVSSKIGTFI